MLQLNVIDVWCSWKKACSTWTWLCVRFFDDAHNILMLMIMIKYCQIVMFHHMSQVLVCLCSPWQRSSCASWPISGCIYWTVVSKWKIKPHLKWLGDKGQLPVVVVSFRCGTDLWGQFFFFPPSWSTMLLGAFHNLLALYHIKYYHPPWCFFHCRMSRCDPNMLKALPSAASFARVYVRTDLSSMVSYLTSHCLWPWFQLLMQTCLNSC